jgi:hypothetical protein
MEATDQCDFLDVCPIFDQFKTEGMKNMWKSLYCQGSKKEQCARRRLKMQGKEVPVSLLPSGRYFDAPLHPV